MRSTICELPNGLGFGTGTISKNARLKNKEIDEDVLAAARSCITDPTSYPLVEFGDDGCGDGRDTALTYQMETGSAAIDGARRTFRKPGQRAKVFGGGLIMAWIMDRIVRGAPLPGESVLSDRAALARKLNETPFSFGGHTDDHASGEASGCGAIDKTPQILQAAVTHCDEIEATLKAVIGKHFDGEVFRWVLSTYKELAADAEYLKDAQGAKTRQLLEKAGSIIKELRGSHNEAFVVLNYVPGSTFNQAKLNALTGSTVQAFAVDAWRIDAYSDLVAQWHNARKDAYKKSLCAGFIYNLAAAAVLTDGSQEIFIRTLDEHLAPAL